MDHSVYHVLLEGSQVGPYDRRTIVGMRIKKALTSDNVLIGVDGAKLTVGDLIRRRASTPFNAERTGSYSVVKGAFAAWLVPMGRKHAGIPRFKGEIEARVQANGVLRLAGRFRQGFGWKDGRVKLALDDVTHARVRGTQVDLALRGRDDAPRGQFTLELFTPETANEFVACLPQAKPFADGATAGNAASVQASSSQAVWVAALSVISVALVVGVLLMVVLHRGGR